MYLKLRKILQFWSTKFSTCVARYSVVSAQNESKLRHLNNMLLDLE